MKLQNEVLLLLINLALQFYLVIFLIYYARIRNNNIEVTLFLVDTYMKLRKIHMLGAFNFDCYFYKVKKHCRQCSCCHDTLIYINDLFSDCAFNYM